MNNKTLALVSYITLIGWLVSFFTYKGQPKDSLVSYHLRQSFGLMIVAVVYNVLTSILMQISNVFSILGILSLVFLVLMIIGILNANKGEEKPLPVIGKMFEGKFNFIP
ncbi:DUF4870 domain-containing protein [Apibacter raozihei]|uniref:DUF4870 domain-containing protein n=1 Tax=Apibacter TaxID=1778601 RepID=UPI000FE3217E|nr:MULTISPECIES: DUF4870 domain-containing protein [Apibacter]